METRVSVEGYTITHSADNDNHNDNDTNANTNTDTNYDINDNDNLRSADSYIEGNLNEVRDVDSQPCDRISDVHHHDESSNNVDCLDVAYEHAIPIRAVAVDDDRSSLDSCGSLRTCCNTLTVKDLLPIETARARFLQIILDHFVTGHVIEKPVHCADNHAEPVEDNFNKRKAGDVQYEGDPRFVLPLMYVANLYETLVNEANVRIASLNSLREKTIGVALEASGGLYRKLTQKFPKTGSYSFKRRELATSTETRARFPELVVQEEKRVRFVVANGLDIVEKPNSMPADDAEWFKRLTGRSAVAITATDYKFYNPRHKVRRASLNASPTIACLPPYPSSNDQDIHSVEIRRELETPSKLPVVSMARQMHFESVIISHHQPLNQNQHTTLISRTKENTEPSHLPDVTHAHQSSTIAQSMGSLQPLVRNQRGGHTSMMPSSPAKFCDECGSPYVRPTSKFCSQCGTKSISTSLAVQKLARLGKDYIKYLFGRQKSVRLAGLMLQWETFFKHLKNLGQRDEADVGSSRKVQTDHQKLLAKTIRI